MKKAKYIGIALIVTLALVGAAYAAWSQNISINGTATTGSMYVQYQDLWYTSYATGGQAWNAGQKPPPAPGQGGTGYVQGGSNGFGQEGSATDASNQYGAHMWGQLVNNPANGDDDGLPNQIDLKFENLYPGYVGTMTVWVKNMGTIPWMLDINDKGQGDGYNSPKAFAFSGLPEWLQVLQLIGNDPAPSGDLLNSNNTADYPGQGVGLQFVAGPGYRSDLSGSLWQGTDYSDQDDAYAQPGQVVPITVWFYVPYSTPNSDMLKDASFTGTMTVTQWTQAAPAETGSNGPE